MVEVFLNHQFAQRSFFTTTKPVTDNHHRTFTFCGDFFTFFLFVLFNLLVYGIMSVLFSM